MDETIFAAYEVNYPEKVTSYSLIIAVIFFLALFSFFGIIIISRTTNLLLLIIPICLLLFFFSLLPSYLAIFSAFGPSQAVKLTNQGVHFTNLSQKQAEKFLPWEKIKQYDVKNAVTKGFAGSLFPTPTKFSLVGVYDEDSLTVDSFGENRETLTALLKEHNVPFGFVH